MPNKIRRQLDIKWTQEELEILQKAKALCYRCSEDEELEDWARDNCSNSFWDIAQGLSEFIGQSI